MKGIGDCVYVTPATRHLRGGEGRLSIHLAIYLFIDSYIIL